MALYTWLILIVIVISLIGFWLNNAEIYYLSSKASRKIKRSKKKAARRKKEIKRTYHFK